MNDYKDWNNEYLASRINILSNDRKTTMKLSDYNTWSKDFLLARIKMLELECEAWEEYANQLSKQ